MRPVGDVEDDFDDGVEGGEVDDFFAFFVPRRGELLCGDDLHITLMSHRGKGRKKVSERTRTLKTCFVRSFNPFNSGSLNTLGFNTYPDLPFFLNIAMFIIYPISIASH